MERQVTDVRLRRWRRSNGHRYRPAVRVHGDRRRRTGLIVGGNRSALLGHAQDALRPTYFEIVDERRRFRHEFRHVAADQTRARDGDNTLVNLVGDDGRRCGQLPSVGKGGRGTCREHDQC